MEDDAMNPVDAVPGPEAALTVNPSPPVTSSVPVQLLEDRVQRLEDAVALLTHHVQWDDTDAVTQEPIARIAHTPVPDPLEEKAASRAMPIPPPPTASLAGFTLPPF